jgi:cysteate synthase
MVEAFEAGRRSVASLSEEEVHRRLSQTYASMLSNATPPWSVVGGVCDALEATGGAMYGATNDEARAAGALLRDHFAFDPCPEACVAAAGLIKARDAGAIGRDETIVLHVTGCGWERSVRELEKKPYPRRLGIRRGEDDRAFEAIGDYLDSHGVWRG